MTNFPEPWTCNSEGRGLARNAEIRDARNRLILDAEEWSAVIPSIQDLRRIVACVNFCRHLSTEFLDLHTASDKGSLHDAKMAVHPSEWLDVKDFVGFIPVSSEHYSTDRQAQ